MVLGKKVTKVMILLVPQHISLLRHSLLYLSLPFPIPIDALRPHHPGYVLSGLAKYSVTSFTIRSFIVDLN